MEIAEAQRIKLAIEQELLEKISNAYENFRKMTGLNIRYISVDTVEHHAIGEDPYPVVTGVSLSVDL